MEPSANDKTTAPPQAAAVGEEAKTAAKLGLSAAEVTLFLTALSSELASLSDPQSQRILRKLLNLVEALAENGEALREENGRLRDENNRLKGEQGRPNVRPNRSGGGDVSSEKERRSREERERKTRESKRSKLPERREIICPVERTKLPPDAQSKGYQSVLVQELEIRVLNIEFKRETFYSPSEGKTYVGALPAGYEGGYGPELRAYVLGQKHVGNQSSTKIWEFLWEHGVQISRATVCRILTQGLETFEQEKKDLYAAGLASGTYVQIDDTGAREHGRQGHVQIVGNEYFTAFFTTERKDRLTILDVLRMFESRRFVMNMETLELAEKLRVSEEVREKLASLPQGKFWDEQEYEAQLRKILPELNLEGRLCVRLKEAAAIAAYHQETGRPVVQILLCDDAPQFKLLTEELALCWVHDGRHYKKLSPVVPQHRLWLEAFRERYWDFYARLVEFKKQPSEDVARELEAEFERLFSTRTGYEALDERIAKTLEKKELLLLVLRHPELPLHNNASELEARVIARRRDVSLHTMTRAGTKANDTMTSIVRTAQKLGLSAFEFIRDRVKKTFQFPTLADLIRSRAKSTAPPS